MFNIGYYGKINEVATILIEHELYMNDRQMFLYKVNIFYVDRPIWPLLQGKINIGHYWKKITSYFNLDIQGYQWIPTESLKC